MQNLDLLFIPLQRLIALDFELIHVLTNETSCSFSNRSISEINKFRPPSLSPVPSSHTTTHAPQVHASVALSARTVASSGSNSVE